MTIKAIAFSAQQRVAARCGIPLQRSHVYESLAAAFGFGSYASLSANAAFDVGSEGDLVAPRMTEGVARRLAELGISGLVTRQVALELTAVVSDHGLRVVRIDDIIDSFWSESATLIRSDDMEEDGGEGYCAEPAIFVDHHLEDWDASSFLCSGLADAAKRGNPKAHYALALLLKADETPVGSSYWYDRQVQGHQLSGVQLEWASAHRDALEREAKRLHHLREAARVGHPDACVDAAAEFSDPALLRTIGVAKLRDPLGASEVAMGLGIHDQARSWCAMAAQAGDIDAVRQMIELFDREDELKCWTWLYFARLLGTDLARDDYRLVNEDGSEYDDDVGGPGFPVGVDGIKLRALDAERDAQARRLACALAERLNLRTENLMP
jgi:TPR repeat protein